MSDAVASSTGSQTGATDDIPYERISLGYGEIENGEYCLAVRKSSGSAPSWIQLLVWGNSGDLQNFVSARSITNPAESSNAGMLAVGAAHYASSNIFTSRIERFSSHGPTMDDRTKPDITGADGADSKIWGNWYGTSQSSPHVAGLAALVKQRFPSYTPAQIASYLKTGALARGAKPNNIWGHGFARLPAIGTPTPVPLNVRCEDLSSSNRNLSGCDLANADLDSRSWDLVDFSGGEPHECRPSRFRSHKDELQWGEPHRRRPSRFRFRKDELQWGEPHECGPEQFRSHQDGLYQREPQRRGH